MDTPRLKLLEAEIRAQWAVIENVYADVEARAKRLQSGDAVILESLAYQLHSLYNAIEDLFKIIAAAFENSIVDTGRWHTELLRRMMLEIEGVRPALVSGELYPLLNELRSFRHFFRHAYQTRLSEERLQIVLRHARQARPLLQRDLTLFLNRLAPPPSD